MAGRNGKQKWSRKTKIGIGIAGLLFLAVSACFRLMHRTGPIEGIFSWTEEAWAEEEREHFLSIASEAGAGEIYQEFSDEALAAGQPEGFIRDLAAEGIQVYLLCGSPEWGYERDGASLCGKIRTVAAYNQSHSGGKIQGIMADVEPYLLPEWESGGQSRVKLMETWLEGMKTAYQQAKEQELALIVCIPNFYDETSPDILNALIEKGCDAAAVMNYNRRDEYGQIEEEAALAARYGKKILCVYELQKAGSHGLTEANTYASEGMDALFASMRKLEKAFADTDPKADLTFAVHYYEPLKEMIEQQRAEK